MRKQEPHALIINGDDFGGSSRINHAIIDSFRRNLISSATIMANMPGFEEACEMTHAIGINGRIGVHLTLTEGYPLTDMIRRCPRLCDADGKFRGKSGNIWHLSPNETQAVERELAAQVDAVIAKGINPTHFDSHQHVHTFWPISAIVIRLAQAYCIRAIRLTRNCGLGLGSLKRLYKIILNKRLARAGLAYTRFFGSALDAKSMIRLSGPLEIMVHPAFDKEGGLIDITSGTERLEEVANWWKDKYVLTNYGELRLC